MGVDKERQEHHDDDVMRSIDFDFADLRWPGWLLFPASVGFPVAVLFLGKGLLAPVIDPLLENDAGKALFALALITLRPELPPAMY